MPEPLIWLEVKGRTDEAEKEIQKAARMNKVALPSPVYTEIKMQEKNATKKENLFLKMFNQNMKEASQSGTQSNAKVEKYAYYWSHLFCNKTLRKHMLLISILW